MDKFFAILSLAVSAAAFFFVYRQIKDAGKATKPQIATGLIDQLYANKDFQNNFERILADIVSFRTIEKQPVITYRDDQGEKDISLQFNVYLNRLQILGNCLSSVS